MSNSGNVAWRYRWGGWGLARTLTDKRKGRVSFFFGGGGGSERQRETRALLPTLEYISNIVYFQ